MRSFLRSLVLLFCAIGPWMVLALPLYLQDPSTRQTSFHLTTSFWLTRLKLPLLVLFLVLGLWTAFTLWRRARTSERRFVKALAALGLLLGVASSAGALVIGGPNNVFEFIFPTSAGQIATAAGADIGDDQLILGVAVGDEARAYPIRYMITHHLFNDRLKDEPFVVTY